MISLIPSVSPALEGIENIPEELKDLDEEELGEIKDMILATVGNVSNDKAVEIATNLLETGIKLFNVVKIISAEKNE